MKPAQLPATDTSRLGAGFFFFFAGPTPSFLLSNKPSRGHGLQPVTKPSDMHLAKVPFVKKRSNAVVSGVRLPRAIATVTVESPQQEDRQQDLMRMIGIYSAFFATALCF